MKKLATLLFATAATPAFAADLVELPPPPPPPVIVAAPVWTGLYVGAHAGGAFHRGGSGLTDAFIRIPATPGSPARPAVPATPFIPGTPGDPGRPAIPPTAPVTVEPGLVEFSFACAGAGPAAACSGAIINNGVETPVELTRAELSAAIAEAGGDPGAAEAAAIAVEVATPGGVIFGTPGSPAIPPTPGTPDQPATPGTPAVPAVEPTPERIVNIADLPGVTRFERDSDGFVGGVHVGADRELGASFGTGAVVVGAVADLSYVDVERFAGLSGFGEEISVREELDYLATLRGRLGLAYGATLVYATGGLAFGSVDTTIVNTAFDDVASRSDTRLGYSVGGGVDFLVNPNFSLGVEYLYTDLGSDDVSRSYDLGGGDTLNVSADRDFDFHTVWAKASFRFN